MEPENQEGLDPKAQEQDALAGQNVSSKSGDGKLSEQQKRDAVTRQEFENLMSELRGLQGKMDKDANKIEKRLEDKFRERIELLGVDLSPEQQRELRLMELADKVDGLYAEQEAEPAKVEPKATVDVDAVFETLGITEPSDNDMRLAIQYANQPLKLAAEITKSRYEKPNPTPGSVVIPGNKSTSTSVDVDALLEEFDSLNGMPQSHVLPSGKTVRQRRDELSREMGGAE